MSCTSELKTLSMPETESKLRKLFAIANTSINVSKTELWFMEKEGHSGIVALNPPPVIIIGKQFHSRGLQLIAEFCLHEIFALDLLLNDSRFEKEQEYIVELAEMQSKETEMEKMLNFMIQREIEEGLYTQMTFRKLLADRDCGFLFRQWDFPARLLPFQGALLPPAPRHPGPGPQPCCRGQCRGFHPGARGVPCCP